jgi:hypothetical protein
MTKHYKIEKRGEKWVVLDSAGEKVLGTHDDEEAAKKQLAAIEASKAKKMELVIHHTDGRDISQGVEVFSVDFEADLQTIKDVDIFAVGVWHGAGSPPEGDKYAEKDLQEIVKAFEAGVIEPAIKITHGADAEQVDIGRLANLKVKAGKLFADFINVPKALYELMKKGLFKQRSAEILWDFKQDGKKWPRVLKAVALLAPGQKAAVGALSEGYQFGALYCYEYSKEKGLEAAIDIYTNPDIKNRSEIMEELLKKYNARDEAHLQEILNEKDAELDKKLEELEQEKEKTAEFEAKESEIKAEGRRVFMERAKEAGHSLPAEEDLVTGIREEVDTLGMQRKYELDSKELEGSTSERLQVFISGLGKRVELGEHSRKGKDTQLQQTKLAATEVDRLAKQYMQDGDADSYEAAVALVAKQEPELHERWLKGE